MADKDPIKRRKLYDYLSNEGMTDLSFDDFSVKYATDNQRQAKLFTYLSNNQMTPLNPDEFNREYFGDVKKKEPADSQENQESFSTLKPSEALTTSGTESQEITEPTDSSVLETYKRFRESTKVTDEDLAGIDEEIKKRTQTEDLDIGFFDGLKTRYDLAKEQIESDFPVLNNFFPDVDTPYNYLREETEQAQEMLKDKYKENIPENFDKEVEKLAIELKKQKKKSEIISRKRRDFMNELPSEEAEKLEDYGGNKLIRENKYISSLVSSKNLFEKTIQEDFESIKERVTEIKAENEPLEYKIQNTQDEAERESLKQQYQANQQRLQQIQQEASERGYNLEAKENGFSISVSDELMNEYDTVVDEIMESQENLGTIEQEIDLFSRSHNAFATSAARVGSATLGIARGLFDMQLMFDEEIARPIVENIPYANEALTLRTAAYNGISDKIGKLSSKIDDSVQERFTFDEAESFDDFFTYTVGTVGEMLPYVGLAATGVGAGTALIGSSSSGNKYREIKSEISEGADYNSWQIVGGSVFAGASEAALGFLPTARILKNSARVSRAIDKGTKTRSFLGTTKRVLGASVTEGVTEGATQVLINFDDKFVLGKDNIGILDNVKDATIAGAIGGGFLPSFGAVGGSVIKPALQGVERKIISRNVEKIVDIERQMMSNRMSDETVGVLKKTYQKLVDKNKETLDKGIERYKKMSVKEFNVVKNAEKEVSLLKETARKIIRNPELSNSIKREQLRELKGQAKKRLQDKENILKDLDKRSVEETPSETYDKVDSNYNVGDVVNTSEFNNVPEIFKDKKLTVQEKSKDRISMTTEEGNSFVIKKSKDAVKEPSTTEVDTQEQSQVIEETSEQTREGETAQEEITFVEDKQGEEVVYSKLQGDRATVIDVSDIPTEAPVIKKQDLKGEQSKTYNNAQKRMFEAKKAEDTSVKNMSKKQAETLKRVRKNPSKTLIPDNGNLEKSLSLDVEQLSPDEVEAYNEYMDIVKSEDFNQLESKDEIQKYADIYENESQSEIDEPTLKNKKPLDSEIKSEIKSSIEGFTYEGVDVMDVGYAQDILSMTDAELDGLTVKDAKDLMRSLEYLKAGRFISSRTFNTIMKVKRDRNASKIQEALKDREFKTLFRDKLSAAIGKFSKGGLSNDKKIKMLEGYLNRSPLGNVDNIIKGKKGDDIFRYLGFENNGTAYSRYESKMKGEFVKRYEKVINGLGKSGSDLRLRSEARVYLIQLSEMYNKNKSRTKGIFHPEEYLARMQQESLKDSDVAKEFSTIQDEWKKLPKQDNGTVNSEEAISGLNKQDRAFYDITSEHNNGEGRDVSRRVAVIEGRRPIIYDYYTPFFVRQKTKMSLSEIEKLADTFATKDRGGYKPEFGAVKERLDNTPLLSFNYSDNFLRNYKDSYKSLFMRPSLIEADRTFSKLLKSEDIDLGEEQKIFIKAAKKISHRSVKSVFASEMYLGDEWYSSALSAIRGIGYNQALTSSSRAVIELMSNAAHAAIFQPKKFGNGLKEINKIDRSTFIDLLEMSGSNQISRLTHGTSSARQEANVNPFDKGYFKYINDFNNSILEKPDKWVAMPLWIGNMNNEFTRLTGKRLQPERIKETEYFQQNKEAIYEARRIADASLNEASSTFNPFTGIMAANLASSTSNNMVLKQFDAFMTRFQLGEFASLVEGWEAVKGNKTNKTQQQGYALIAATMLRMSMYQASRVFVQDYIINSLAGMIGFEEEEKQEVGQILKVQSISSLVNAIVMRRLGNFHKVAMSTGIEGLNARYGADIGIRDDAEDYGYDNALTYAILRRDKDGDIDTSFYSLSRSALKILGPYSMLAKSSFDLAHSFNMSGALGNTPAAKTQKTQDKYDKKFKEDLANVILGTLPLPVPRDIKMVTSYLVGRKSAQDDPKRARKMIDDINSLGKKINNKGFIRPAGDQDKLFLDSSEIDDLLEN